MAVEKPGKFINEGITASKLKWEYSGSLPKDLTLSKGKISGKPQEFDAFNMFNFTVRAGDESITWTAEELPEGLNLDSKTGINTGTPTHIFNKSVAITAANSAGNDTKNVKITIKAIKPKILTSSLIEARVKENYNFTLEVSGSKNLTWSGEGLPAGLTINSNGTISGTPSEEGTFKFYVSVSNEAGSKRKKLTLKILKSESEQAANDFAGSESESPANKNLYEFTVSFDKKVPEDSLLVWHSFPNGQESKINNNDDSAEFFDDEGEEIDSVPENYCVTVSAWFEAEIIYKPVIAVKYIDDAAFVK